ncbi:hypothetical protein DYB26_013959 [Aphanomyces astaci]|uniref:Uncharacterized protein n=1 Tax=Aphanomyces astaci TaxID=112090 RepID=A0A397D2D4_APHAT|nr:hypothetical protein DYB38_002877 [Aphanomyces astaci]RHZ15032.1 hypothetical protein DYB26_013959 [Aphanomyces astaci]
MSANRIVTKQTEWLYEAAAEGATERVKKLLQEKDADVNFHQRAQVRAIVLLADPNDANSPLHEASFRKNPDIVRVLLRFKDQHMEEDMDEKSKDPQRKGGQSTWSMINAKNQFGNTPLHAAAMAGCAATVQVLLDAGASVDELNNVLCHICASFRSECELSL